MIAFLALHKSMKRWRFAIKSEKYVLRVPRTSDFEAWKILRTKSRLFLQPWEPLWRAEDMTLTAFRLRVRHINKDFDEGTSIQLFIFLQKSDVLIGGITIGPIRKGVAQICTLGYWMGEQHSGKGHMSAALRLIIPYIFDEMRLHRIEAACIPSNERSASLLKKAGFSKEGFLRKYLLINGLWQDHHLYALLHEDHDATRKH